MWLINRTKIELIGLLCLIQLLLIHNFFKPFNIVHHVVKNGSIECYRFKEGSLLDISELSPKSGKSIFFLETTCKSYQEGKIVISPRQACSVESAALMNPDHEVYLLFVSPGLIENGNTMSDRTLKALLTYKNIHMRHLDFEKFTKNTPVEKLYNNREIEASHYAVIHASDVFRLLILWKYGGIYLDLDVIVTKPFTELALNYVGMESDSFVGSGVIALSLDGVGHRFASECLQELQQHFQGDLWGVNGPELITKLLKIQCQVNQVSDMSSKDCQGLKVYPIETFCPVHWTNYSNYFDNKFNDIIFNITKDSYAIHVWNNLSKEIKIEPNTEVPYTLFAKKFCPKVFAECKGYF